MKYLTIEGVSKIIGTELKDGQWMVTDAGGDPEYYYFELRQYVYAATTGRTIRCRLGRHQIGIDDRKGLPTYTWYDDTGAPNNYHITAEWFADMENAKSALLTQLEWNL